MLPDNQMLCYAVQGECGSVYNLISNKNFHVNALFVPNSGKRNATWNGALGVVIGSRLQLSNATKIMINATSKSICVGEGITGATRMSCASMYMSCSTSNMVNSVKLYIHTVFKSTVKWFPHSDT